LRVNNRKKVQFISYTAHADFEDETKAFFAEIIIKDGDYYYRKATSEG